MKKSHTIFGPEHAVINLSRIGLRYFRIGFEVNNKYKKEIIDALSQHPNVGWVFEGEGWCTIAAGFWAKDNAEINNISDSVRSLFQTKASIVFQSEVTALYSFGNRPVGGANTPMCMIDPHVSVQSLTPIEIDYIKLITLSSEYTDKELAGILDITTAESKKIKKELLDRGIISGFQKRINYNEKYTKLFLDTASIKKGNIDAILEDVWNDKNCIYFCKTNAKYNFEIEIISNKKSDITKYSSLFGDSKVITFTNNHYTNMYPVNKVANLREIRDMLISESGKKVIDLSNSKIWYLNYKSAQAYLDIFSNKEYYEVMEKDELSLFDSITKDIRREYTNTAFNVIDLGSGNGLKGKYFIESLGIEKAKAYIPVDVTPIELESAKFVHANSKYRVKEIVLDFEKLQSAFPIQETPGSKNIHILLGGTYGNFKSQIINKYLKNTNDLLLVTMPIVIESQTKVEIEHSYTNKSIEDMGLGILEQVGFKRNDFMQNKKYPEFISYANIEDDNRNIISFYLARNVRVNKTTYAKGTRFKIMSSWKPTLAEFRNALETDFVIKKIYHNKNMAIALIQR